MVKLEIDKKTQEIINDAKEKHHLFLNDNENLKALVRYSLLVGYNEAYADFKKENTDTNKYGLKDMEEIYKDLFDLHEYYFKNIDTRYLAGKLQAILDILQTICR
jgi:hypothetical protein